MTRWEYQTVKMEPGGWLGGKVDHPALTEELNRMGGEGWELVSAFDTSQGNGYTCEIVLIFKRPA